MPNCSFTRRASGVCSLFFALSIGSAQAETIVAAGHSVTLLTVASIDQVCHSQGTATINILEPPHGGFIEVMQTKAYPNFNALNTRSRCNTLKLPATEVIYQSAGNYLGPDSVTIEIILPGGGVRRLRMPITVRPVTADFAPAPPPGAETVAPEASGAAVPDRPKTVAHRKKSTLAARHHPAAPDAKAAVRQRTPTAVPKDPLVNT